MKEIYDKIYSTVPSYDGKMEYKIDLVKTTIAGLSSDASIIDIGCGKGHYARSIKSLGYHNYTALEFSTSCCEEFLKDVPHINADFLEYGPTLSDGQYDLCLCMDVLEHISYDRIDEFVSNINRISEKSLLGIANHSDMILGEELHLIQENISWWIKLLEKHFDRVHCIDDTPKFFMFVCENV
jgi:2-polyprenyl-3-methyl-5-hydroxy-6-metoxy-1,4-benzoquinol methylase